MSNTEINTNLPVIASTANVEITSLKVLEYVHRFRSFARKTADNVIDLAKTMVEAESELCPPDFNLFCQDIGVKKGGSTYKKLKKIGDNAMRFEPILSTLPGSWTTIYKLASLDEASFGQVTSNGNLTPFTTGKEIDQLLDISGPGKVARKNPNIILSGVDKLPANVMSELYKDLLALEDKYALKIEMPQGLEGLLSEQAMSEAA